MEFEEWIRRPASEFFFVPKNAGADPPAKDVLTVFGALGQAFNVRSGCQK